MPRGWNYIGLQGMRLKQFVGRDEINQSCKIITMIELKLLAAKDTVYWFSLLTLMPDQSSSGIYCSWPW